MTTVQPTTTPDASGSWILSVDFGTTSTVAAMTFANGATEVLEVDGERRTPSVVLVDDDGTLVVGNAAVGLAASRPDRTIRAPKRRLGDQTPVVLGGKPFAPVDLVAAILRHVLGEAERHVGSAPDRVRLTHPATWSRPLQQRLLEAAAKAGMPEAELVPEPVAAAMTAADQGIPEGDHIAIYDLGGGTFDTTVVRSTGQGFVVVGHPIGDRQIGGELFDEALMNHVGSRLDPDMWEKLQVSDERSWHQASTRLLTECRRVKETLSTHSYGEIVVGTPSGMIEERVTRDELEAIVAPYLEASIDLLERCVDDVEIDPSSLAGVHMVGGASRMPLAAQMVEEAFPGVGVSRRGDPRTAVAVGAALVEISEQPDGMIVHQNTTVEGRQRSIDAEAAAIDAAAAARATGEPRRIAPPVDPSVIDHTPGAATSPPATTTPPPASTTPATPPVVDPPTVAEAPTVAETPSSAATTVPLTPLGDATVAPEPQPAPQQTAPQQPTPYAAQPYQAAPASGGGAPPFTPGPPPGEPAGSGSSSPPVAILAGVGVLAIALITGIAIFISRGGDDTASSTTTMTIVDKATPSSAQGISGAPSTESTTTTEGTTTTESTSTTESTTTEPTTTVPDGPTRELAVAALLEVDELNGDGWQSDTFSPQPIEPCGVADPFAPVFLEGRAFIKNANTPQVVTAAHQVAVYADAEQAAAVLSYYQSFASSCPTDTVVLEGITFAASFESCDPFSTCDSPLPQSTADLLGGDQFALQFAVLEESTLPLILTDQIYTMRVGRSIITFEYVVAARPTDEQFAEGSTSAITAWTRAAVLPD